MSHLAHSLSKEHILSEVKKLQYLYGLKREIRYGQKRPENDLTESVAEHLYGMNLLAHYFLPLENPAGDWDTLKILTLIMVHDFDEIETGDTIGYLKTPEMYAAERTAQEIVIEKSPRHLQVHFSSHLDEYEAQSTAEARFVKAIDRFEPLIQTYSNFGKVIFEINKTKLEHSERIKETYIKPFPIMYSYYNVIHAHMEAEDYFYKD